MLLDPLVNVIETLKERIQAHGATLRESETRTRMALIDPLLSALGWDISDPAVVTPEYAAGGGRADYALLGPDGKPAATVEAKKLGEPLAAHRMQMLNYSNASGVEYAGLTDGDHWELYEVFKRGQLEERRILDVSITGTPIHRCALELLLLWRPNLGSGQPVVASKPVLAILPAGNPPSHTLGPTLDREVDPGPSVPSEPGWTPISQVDPMTRDRPPNAIRINQDPATEIKYWNQVLIETTEWLCGQEKLTSRECPVTVGTTRTLVALTPAHISGKNFKSPRKISTGMFVELDFSGKDIVKHTRTLLTKLGVPVDTVELRFK